jgi:hypothetical protein
MALYLCPTIIGTCLIWQLPRTNVGGCLAGYYLVCCLKVAAFTTCR